MTFEEIVEKQRQVYLHQLDEFWRRKSGAKEILLSYNTEEPTMLLNLTRFDYLENNNDNYEIEELSPDTYISHDKAEFSLGEMAIELYPFYWHGCDFILDKKLEDISFITKWAKYWLDEDGFLETKDGDYSNAIHSITIPEISNEATIFSVDFGTSPVDCFLELVDKIASVGVQRVIITSTFDEE